MNKVIKVSSKNNELLKELVDDIKKYEFGMKYMASEGKKATDRFRKKIGELYPKIDFGNGHWEYSGEKKQIIQK